MIVVGHEVDEVQSLCHRRHVVGLIDGLEPSRDGGSQQEAVLVELGSHLPQELGMVLLVFGKSGTVISTT